MGEGLESNQSRGFWRKNSTSLDFLSAPPPPFLRRGRESEGWEEQFFPISGHQREKVWRWGVVGVEQETGAGNDVEGEQEKVL